MTPCMHRGVWIALAAVVLVAGGLWLASLFSGLFQDDLPAAPEGDVQVRLAPVADGFASPTFALEDDTGLYVIEQAGRIVRTAPDGEQTPWLDLQDRVRGGGERGLLGLAFDADRSHAYVHYTDTTGDTVLSRFTLDGDTVLPGVEEVLLEVEQPYSNHNGGMIAFGPDGYLYMGLGDGGAAGDPHGHGQDPHTLLGSILRLDVSGPNGYAIPPDNPFAAGQPREGEGAPEVWAFGLRNPWRFHFGPQSGDLWVGDVGQNNIEEVTRIPAGRGGENLGWDHWEGSQPYGTRVGRTDHRGPTGEYDHDGGHCSVTGGPVARGPSWAAAGLAGTVFFADYCSGVLWTLTPDGDDGWAQAQAMETGLRISSFGEGLDGTVFVVDHAGTVYELVPTG